MDPMGALVVAIIVATLVMMVFGDELMAFVWGAADAGRAQAASEARRLKQEIKTRVSAKVRVRLDEGSQAGPLGSAWWWAYAGAKTYRGTRAAMRGVRKGATAARTKLRRENHGPILRIADAMLRGGAERARRARERWEQEGPWWRRLRFEWAREGAHRWRDRQSHRFGVCDQCGVQAAAAALVPEPRPWPDGTDIWEVCQGCAHHPAPVETPAPEEAGEEGDLPDMEVVDPPQLPAAGPPAVPVILGGPQPAPATPAAALTPTANGDLMSRPSEIRALPAPEVTRPGTGVATRPAASPARGDAAVTHGGFTAAAAYMHDLLSGMPAALEVLRNELTHVEVDRDQILGMLAFADDVDRAAATVGQDLAHIHGRQGGVVEAVTDMGGPEHAASAQYVSDMG